MSTTSAEFWRASGAPPDPQTYQVDGRDETLPVYKPEVFATIETEIRTLDAELRSLSLDIHGHPELKFEEIYAHDTLTAFMRKHKWAVTDHYHLKTAWVATFTHKSGGRTIGVNSEMDALPGVGHACGHNLIAIAGVAVALGLKAAMIKHDIPGKIILLGTPAEEGGAGKVMLLDKGAYSEMDICVMCHPAPGPKFGASLSSSLALQRFEVEYRGHTAHAALSPWQGQNALDAAVAAYTNVALLRQQIKPSHRVHGVFKGNDWAANIIPDNSSMLWYARAPTLAEVEAVEPRVRGCFEAASLATGCKVEITVPEPGVKIADIRQNKALGHTFAQTWRNKTGPIDYEWGIASASTDFGNITYALPSIHPGFSIPTVPDGGNHTRAFTAAAATPEAHQATLEVSKALGLTCARVLLDDDFFEEVKATFEEDLRKARAA
ncbi:hypothetical protein FA95DRAFT_1487564 [Auriscalpium vulgare]|uniref:Uncharacterized protein n=1 Tax=Auriscalpium vulgare TaxID=40419 RepID=A0ACB8S1R1_9AGAM|nr:hypothetical protein FA95DRAFT_1487564 [Auriscalpium vulgare]